MSDSKEKQANGTGQKDQTTTDANKANQQKVELGFLEEDDEFEEFETEDWKDSDKDGAQQGAVDTNLWEDNWDDDNVEDDFTNQLRSELEKRAQQTA